MKKIILLFLVLSTYYNSFSQLTYVPDDRFEALLIQYGLDDVLDDYVLTSNITSYNTALYVNLRYIQDFTGLQDFVNLKALIINGNRITTLDVTGLSSLEYLSCDNTYIQHNSVLGDSERITSIIGLSSCPNLENLYLQKNEITTLDVSNNPLLIDIDVHSNMLTSINLNNTTNLIDLNVNDNKLNTINLSQSTLLNHVYAGSNLLTSISLNNTTNLSYLDLRNNNINTIDLTPSVNLTELHLNNNSLGNLNLINNPLLTTVNASNNTIGSINLNGLINLSSLTLTNNNINTIDLSSAVNLTQLAIDNNQLTSLDLSQNANLILASCNSNNIANINATSNSLQFLLCYGNVLTQLDLTSTPQLLNLSASYNSISTIDLSNNLLLTDLDLNSNDLSTIDVTNNTAITKLTLKNNSLSSINVDNNINLTQLYLSGNQLKRLNLDQNINLNYLYCEENLLAYIDLNNCPTLIFAFLEYNNLIEIKLQNGNNQNMYVKGKYNPDLTCVEVDDSAWSTTNWTGSFFDIQVNFSFDCGYAAIWYDNSWSYLPSITHNAIVLENYETLNQGNLDLQNLTIFPNGAVTIGANSYIKLEHDLVNNGDINVMNQGSFVQTDNTSTVSGDAINFDVEIKTNSLLDTGRYTYFSSPTQGGTLGAFNWAMTNRIWEFDTTIQDWILAPISDTMEVGKGYIVRPNSNQTFPYVGITNFKGSFNNGIITKPLTYNPGGTDDDSTLVGNPYPSAIDTNLLLTSNPRANAFYFWTHENPANSNGDFTSNDDYAVWNNSGVTSATSGNAITPAPAYIASGQGFFATANGNPGNLELTFNNTLRVTGNNNNFIRPANSNLDKIWVNLTTSINLNSQILIAFNPICSDAFDAQYDAEKLSFGFVSLTSQGIGNETDNLAIQTRDELTNDDTIIPLRIDITDANIINYSINIDHFENLTNENIYLKDNELNITHNLKESEYNFTLNTIGTFSTRFELLFSRNTLITNEITTSSNDLLITKVSDSNFKVEMKNNLTISNFKIFDVLGKLIININPNQNSFNININSKEGIILFTQSTLENGNILSKKIIVTD